MTPGLRIDLHVHSDRSPDGRATVDALVAAVEARHLDGLALTDHNTVGGLARLAELARARPTLRLIPGVELSTSDGHLLALGLTEVPPTGISAAESIEWIVARGGVAVPSHPFRRVHGVGGLSRSLSVRALEVINGHNGPRADRRAREVAAARGIGATGGSDAHGVEELGRAWTAFPDGADRLDQLLEALQGGRTVAEGRSAGFAYRAGIAARSLGLRLRRGLRPI